MNEKFFDLKKEKQDRMINAGLKIFATNGYRHASTDEIVKEAGISKGLLFHYFGSKSGYYSFLFDYATRYAILELGSEIHIDKLSPPAFFTLQRQILHVEERLLSQYPFLYLFLQTCSLEDDTEALSYLATPEKSVAEFYQEMNAQADLSLLAHADQIAGVLHLIHHTRFGLMRELFSAPVPSVKAYAAEMKKTLDLLEQIS